VAYKYLPIIYFFTTTFMWSFEYLRKTKYDVGGFLKGWVEVFRIPATEKRKPVDKTGLEYLKKVEARLWF